MENTVIGVYDSYSQAQAAMNDLVSSGVDRSHINLNPEQGTTAAAARTDSGEQHGIGHFFRTLFGMEDTSGHSDVYSEAVRRGSCVLTAEPDSDEERERIVEIMNRHDPVDIDERASLWRSQGWTGYDVAAPMMTEEEIRQDRSRYAQGSTDTGMQGRESTTSPQADLGSGAASGTGETARIPVVEEELKVGKREVQRGGVRVFSRVKETPVHESVTLREEHVKVERHPVDQPATEADMAAFKEGAVEMREMAEEPVVEKVARVVEEVVVG
jgi:stress response protein YsnF